MGLHLNYLKSCCHSFPSQVGKFSLAPERPLSLRKNYLCTLFPQGMWLTPISILFWWKHTSQKTSKIRFHSRLSHFTLRVILSPQTPSPSLPCLMACKKFPGGTPHAVHHLRPRFPLTFIPQTATSEEAAKGSMHSAEDAPESGHLEGPTSPPATRVNPDSDLNWLCLVSPSVKWE